MLRLLAKVAIGLVVLLALAAAYIYFNFKPDWIALSAEPWAPPPANASAEAPAGREACAQEYPHRRAWFGDLHVHTSVSFDASSRGMLVTAADAYRFARGEVVNLGPWDEQGIGARPRQLAVPLDFAAVTDHAEWLGEFIVCTSPDSPAYDGEACRQFRDIRNTGRGDVGGLIGRDGRLADICGPNAANCRDGLAEGWQRNFDATEQYYDRSSDCRFTTFHGYEYTNNFGLSKIHRNVIFRNERAPELPISSLEVPEPLDLMLQLERQCNQAEGHCEAITIPHNPNVSNGNIFSIPWRDESIAEQQQLAAMRARIEPVAEMMQIKGESECKAGMWNVLGEDEYCNFEKQRGLGEQAAETCEGDTSYGAIAGLGCQSRLDFARYAVIEGMVEQQRMGVNPLRIGFIGSTDTHNGTPGDVGESNHGGCCSNLDNELEYRLDDKRDFAGFPVSYRNPGGLAGVWAERNDRDTLFSAIQRREVFATSGPRIQPRFYAGADIPESICEGDFAATGDATGVPMGGLLAEATQTPRFAAHAVADPNGGKLERLQVIKVWPGEGDNFHQQVIDIAGHDEASGSVDLASCQTNGAGHTQLCATWSDPEYDANRPAAYYLRVIESPSCRWTWEHCLRFEEGQRPPACNDPQLPKTIQERAWSSPIWTGPAAALR